MKIRLRNAFALLLVPWVGVGIAAPLRAVQDAAVATPRTDLPSAREVVDRFLQVTNARAILEKTSNVRVKGKLTLPAFRIEGPLEILGAKPDRFLVRSALAQVGETVQGFDGQVGWSSDMTGTRLLEGNELLQARLKSDWEAPLKKDEDYEKLELLGKETVEGVECYELEVVARPLEGMDRDATLKVRSSTEYYAVDSGLLVGGVSTQSSPLGEIPIHVSISDYKEFAGSLMATKMKQSAMGQSFEFTLESVEYDVVPADAFAVPKEIQALIEEKKAREGSSAGK